MDIASDEETKQEQPRVVYTFDVPQVVTLLQGILSGNNEKIKESTKILRIYTKQVECVPPFLAIIAESPEIQLRQIAAVLLKRNIFTIFNKMSNESDQDQVKRVLLERYFLEPAKPVRESIGRVISVLMDTQNVKEKGWQDLVNAIDQKTAVSADVRDREKGIALISYMVELTANEINDKYEKYLAFFKTNLTDPERIIRVQTLKTLLNLFELFDRTQLKTVETFKGLLQTMLQVLDDCVKHNEEDIVHLFFDVFSSMAENNSKFLNTEFLQIVQYIFSNSIIYNNSLPLNLKEAGLDFITTLAYHHRSVLTEDTKVLKNIIICLVNLSSQPFQKQSMEDDAESIQDVSLWLLETLALRLPKKHVYKPIMAEIQRLIRSNDENQMNAGFLILAGISEGCSHLLKNDLEKVVLNDLLPLGLNSPSGKVRGAALTSLGYLSEFLVPDIVDYHEMIIPILLKGFNEQDIKVAEKSVFSMDIFCENMENEIIPYLGTIMPALASLITSTTASNFMKKMAIMSIGSCVTSAQQDFRPFLADCVDFMSKVVHSKSEQDFLTVQAAAIQSLGKIFMVFYSEDAQLVQNYVFPCMDTVFKMMLNIDDSEIREASLSFFYLLASSMGEDFSSVLDKITDFAFQIAKSQKGISYIDNPDEFSLDSDSDDASMDHKNASEMKVHMNFLDEKAAAIHAIGEFAQACPIQFSKYFEQAVELLDKTYQYFYENIRIQAVICYKNLAEGMIKSLNNGKLPKYQKGSQGVVQYPKEVHEFLVFNLYNKYMDWILEDESIDVKTTALENLCELISSLGPSFIVHHYKETVKLISKRLRRHLEGFKKTYLGVRTVVHNDKDVDENVDSGDGSEDDEDADDRMMMFEYAIDLIPALAKAMGSEFKPFLIKMYTPLMTMTQKNYDIDEKIQVLGVFAQTFKHIPELIELYQDRMINLFEEMLAEKDDGLNRNVAFACGVFCQKNLKAMLPHFPRILKVLSRVYEESELLEAKENALAGLARLIIISPENVPVEECLHKILGSTPFKGDVEENKTVIKMLITLCQKNENLIAKYLEPAMMLILDGLIHVRKYKMSDKAVKLSSEIIKAICNNNNDIRGKVEGKVFNLSERNKARVIDLLK